MKTKVSRNTRSSLLQQTKNVIPIKKRGSHLTGSQQEPIAPLRETIQKVVELWRRRQAWHRAEKSLTLQIKSFCRGLTNGKVAEANILYDSLIKGEDHPLSMALLLSVAPLMKARSEIVPHRLEVEKQLKTLGKSLPGYEFCAATESLSEMTIAALIGEAPGINYRGFLDFPSCWTIFKRFGLAVMDDGKRQRKISGHSADAIAQGYRPARRSVMWVIGDVIIKGKGPYRKIYDDFKVAERNAAEAKGLTILPASQIEKKKQKELYISEGHIHNRAKRKMEKALLRDIWTAFRDEARRKRAA